MRHDLVEFMDGVLDGTLSALTFLSLCGTALFVAALILHQLGWF